MPFHFQSTVDDWPQAVAKLPAGAFIKAVDRADILRDAKIVNPGVKTGLRHWYDQGQVFGGTLEENKQRARAFFASFIDGTFRQQYAPYVDVVFEYNEYLASSHTGQELADRLTWARAVAEVWRYEYRSMPEYAHIRLALLSCPVGNDIHRDFAALAIQHDCYISYHAYDHWINGQRDPHSWQYHCGRWHFMEQAWGLKPRWIFGEAGAYGGVLEGWRHPAVLNGDAAKYVEAVRTWIREIKTTPAYKEGRVMTPNLFTSGRAGDTWRYYWTEMPEMDAIADMVRAEWTPVIAPPPPPLPTPPEPDPPAPAFVQNIISTLPVNTASQWYPYATRPLSAIANIVIHHSEGAATGTALQAAQYHTQTNGWPVIGYHFWVTNMGVVQKTNLMTTHSYHAGSANATSIGVCLAGSFTNMPPTPAQMEATRELLNWLRTVLPGATVVPHLAVAATQCPGNTWTQWWDALTGPPPPAPEPRTWEKLVYLVPQTTTGAQYIDVANVAFATKTEVAFSADSAFARPPNVTSHKVVVYDVAGWGSASALEAWVAEHYKYTPATVIEYRGWPASAAGFF